MIPSIGLILPVALVLLAVAKSLAASWFFKHPILCCLLSIAAAPVLSLLLGPLARRVAGKLAASSRGQRVFALLSSIALALVFGFAGRLVTIFDFYPTAPRKVTVEINALGTRNANSKSSALVAILDADGRIQTHTWSKNTSWHYEPATNNFPTDNGFVFAGQTAETLIWTGIINREVCLHFRQGDHYGQAALRITCQSNAHGGVDLSKDQQLDLYQSAIPDSIDGGNSFRSEKAILFRLPVQFSWSWLAINLCAGIGKLVALSAVLLATLLWLRDIEVTLVPRRFSWPVWAGLCLTAMACVLPYWLAFYPAIMTNDSLEHWRQLSTLQLDDCHPIAYTLGLWLLTRLWYSPAMLAFSAIFGWGATAATLFSYLRQQGHSTRLLFAACVLVSLAPVTALICITIWKDIPYGFLMALLALMCTMLVETRGDWVTHKRGRVLLIATLIAVILMRANGLVTCVTLCGILALTFTRQAKSIFLVACLAITLGFGTDCLLRNSIKSMHRTTVIGDVLLPLQQALAVVHYGGPISDKQISQLANYVDYDAAQKSFMRSHVESLLRVIRRENTATISGKSTIGKIWLELLPDNAEIYLRQWADITSSIWSIDQYDGTFLFTTERGIQPNPYNLSPHTKLPGLHDQLLKAWNLTEMPQYSWLFWRPTFWLFVSLFFATLYSLRKGDVRGMCILYPIAANLAGLCYAIPIPAVRYFWSIFLLVPFLAVAAFCNNRNRSLATLRPQSMIGGEKARMNDLSSR